MEQDLTGELKQELGDYINMMKTTFDLNFYLYEEVEQHGYRRESVN